MIIKRLNRSYSRVHGLVKTAHNMWALCHDVLDLAPVSKAQILLILDTNTALIVADKFHIASTKPYKMHVCACVCV